MSECAVAKQNTHDFPNVKDEQEDGDPANMGVEDKEEDTTDDACITIKFKSSEVWEANVPAIGQVWKSAVIRPGNCT